jgi:hypothetical protein
MEKFVNHDALWRLVVVEEERVNDEKHRTERQRLTVMETVSGWLLKKIIDRNGKC